MIRYPLYFVKRTQPSRPHGAFRGSGFSLFAKKFPRHRTAPYNFRAIPAMGEGTVKRMEMDREQILEALRKIALSKPNDAVMLALAPEEQYVPGLDLWGVSEFKRNSGGAVEIKFADRVKAISLLLECSGGGEDGMNALLSALEEGA